MQYLTYGEPNSQYPVAILIKSYLLTSQVSSIRKYYVDPLVALGIPIEDIIVIGLPYDEFSKVSAKTVKAAIPELQAYMESCGCLHVLVADTPYLKNLSKKTNLKNLAGELIPSVHGSERLFKARLYSTYIYNDKAAARVAMSMSALAASYFGFYATRDILVEAHYPQDLLAAKAHLSQLMQYPMLAVDIEGFGLRLDTAGVATIGFAWSKDSGVAFAVDYVEDFQVAAPNWAMRDLVRDFLTAYCAKGGICLYHGISYDVKNLVANLFMRNDLLNYKGMVDGLEILTENALCTKDISYLATNSAAGNTLDLKHLVQEYTGNYAIDVTDVTAHPVATVLKYNLIDCCATFWLYEKNYPIIQQRLQEPLYARFQRTQRTLITIELTGMPLDMPEVIRLRLKLDAREAELLHIMRRLPAVERWVSHKTDLTHDAYQQSVKGDGHSREYFAAWKHDELQFSPSQDAALIWILHTYYGLPVIDKTRKTRQPSTGKDTLLKHVAWIHAAGPSVGQGYEIIAFLEDVIEWLNVQKINSTFVKAFITKSILKSDGVYYLHGNLNQGGTISGRLSSNSP